MRRAAGRTLPGLFKAALVIGILAVALLALLVAWWIALLFVGTWLLVRGARRLLQGSQPAARAGATTIDGEYRVEHGTGPSAPLTLHEPGGGHPKD